MTGKAKIWIPMVGPHEIGSCVVEVWSAFRVTSAERVEGIDYDAFTFRAFVGHVNQTTNAEASPATDLFVPGGGPWTEAFPGLGFDGLAITMIVENKSDRALPFAVLLVGEVK